MIINYGHNLLSLCNNSNLRIVNGRFGAESWLPTCKDNSLVDYAIVSTDLLAEVLKFSVDTFDPLLSDIQCAISLNLHSTVLSNRMDDANLDNFQKEQPEKEDSELCTEKVRWKAELANLFKENLNFDRINVINDLLDNFEGKNDKTQDFINKINEEVVSIFKECAKETGVLQTIGNMQSKSKKRNNPKKWFNKECYLARKNYHRCKNAYRRNRDAEQLQELKNKSKAYKKCVNKNMSKYQKEFNKKLRSLKTSNPKEFWKLLCTNDKKKSVEKIQIDVFNEYFKKLSTDNNKYEIDDFKDTKWQGNNENLFINSDFTDQEIKDVVKSLKNNKSPGEDLIVNEFIKCTVNSMCPVYRKLFNAVLHSGVIPEIWTRGMIVPIFKKKGDPKDPSNYRGITLLSCIGKVFTSLISMRLNSFVENFELLGEEQAGFRKKHSTVDHLFVLYGLIDIYIKKARKKLYCTFVDYSKAFDTVPHIHLWRKLLSTGINGKIFNVIKAMYESAKSCIKQNNYTGSSFSCEIGVRQGENLSPLLFALYLNDLEEFLAKAYNGLTYANSLMQEHNQTEDVIIYLKLFIILYADDTIILAESSQEMQAALNGMYHYCQIWKLKINTSKTKVVVFGSKSNKVNAQFKLGDYILDIVNEYDYLGISIKHNDNLSPGIVKLRDQASRAMYALINKSKKLGLSIDLQLQLFDSLVLPIALYGCEVWGCKNLEITEQLHLKFMRMLLRVNKATPKCMLYGELGRLPLKYNIEIRMISFWYRIISGNKRKLSYNIYQLLYNLDKTGIFQSDWIIKIKEILTKCNLYDAFWINQDKRDISAEVSVICSKIR
jgi:hypothetical protein